MPIWSSLTELAFPPRFGSPERRLPPYRLSASRPAFQGLHEKRPLLVDRSGRFALNGRCPDGRFYACADSASAAMSLVRTPTVFLSTSSVPITSTMPIARQISGLRTKPAITKAYERDGHHRQDVGDLRRHMLQVVAVRAGGRHDGRVRDGRHVIARHGSRQAGGDADGQKLGLVGEDGQHDGDEDAEGPQLVPVAKAKPPPTRKMMAGSMLYRPAAAPSMQPETNSAAPSALVMLLSVSAKVRMMMAGTMASKPGTMDFIASFERDHAAQDQVHEREQQRDERTPRQGGERIGVTEREDDVHVAFSLGIPEAADVEHADDAEHDEDENGNDHVEQLRPHVLGGFVVAERSQLAIAQRSELGLRHRAVIEAHDDDGDHEHEREQRVEVERNGADEQLDSVDVQVGCNAGDRRRPRGHRGDHADRSRRGVDEIRKLRARDHLRVGDGAHDRADRQAVEVVVDEDEHAEHEGGQLGADAALDVFRRPLAERGGSARGVDERDEDAEDHQEDEDARAIGQRRHEARDHGVLLGSSLGDERAADDGVDRADGVEPGEQERTDQYADEKRAVGFPS